MRHRRIGRRLGRSSSHRLAMFRNMASSLFLTLRNAELDGNAPKVPGRIVTTVTKAKEIRPYIERCITIARRSLRHTEAAAPFGSSAKRGSPEWKAWRNSDQWKKWAAAIGPVVTARRRALEMLGDKQAVQILFEQIGPKFADRKGGYTRILRLAKPRLGDAGTRAIIEFVGERDRVPAPSQRPDFGAQDAPAGATTEATAE